MFCIDIFIIFGVFCIVIIFVHLGTLLFLMKCEKLADVTIIITSGMNNL